MYKSFPHNVVIIRIRIQPTDDMPPWRTSMLQEKPSSALKREDPALQIMILFHLSNNFVGHFCPPGSGSGSRRPKSTLLLSQPNLKALRIGKQFLNPLRILNTLNSSIGKHFTTLHQFCGHIYFMYSFLVLYEIWEEKALNRKWTNIPYGEVCKKYLHFVGLKKNFYSHIVADFEDIRVASQRINHSHWLND